MICVVCVSKRLEMSSYLLRCFITFQLFFSVGLNIFFLGYTGDSYVVLYLQDAVLSHFHICVTITAFMSSYAIDLLSYLYLFLLFCMYSDYFDKLASFGHILFPSCGIMDEDVRTQAF